MKDVVFGVNVPPEGRDFEEMKKICLAVERLGFDLFAITDHFMNIALPNGPSRHPLECWSTLAGLAAVTSKIRLGPLVSCYYYRPPTVLAKIATTVDIISKGRLVFGLGAGWHQKEFEGFMGRFPSVKERMMGLEEAIQICISMFKNERTTFRGKIYHVENALNSPPPIQRPPPLIVGGGGVKKTLRIAAKYADISHLASNPSEKVLDHKLDALRKHCRSVRRDFDEIKKGISVSILIGLTEKEIEAKIRHEAQLRGIPPTRVGEYRSKRGPVTETPEQWVQVMNEYIGKGVTFFNLVFVSLENAKLFAEEIMQKLR